MIHHWWIKLAHRIYSLSHCVYMNEFEYGYTDSGHTSNPHEGYASVLVGFRLFAKARNYWIALHLFLVD